MRLTGGFNKGNKLNTKLLKKVRPTASKVREAIFNILGSDIVDAQVLDLYAGSGIVGFEALSRGANSVMFVDISKKVLEEIKKNHIFTLNAKNKTFHGKAASVLKIFADVGVRFDFIYIDPPYKSDELETVLPIIGKIDILNDDATVIVEHFYKTRVQEQNGYIFFKKKYIYGDTVLSLFIHK